MATHRRLRRSLHRLRRAASMPPGVVVFKVVQALRLRVDRHTGELPRSEARVRSRWASADMAEVAKRLSPPGRCLLDANGLARLKVRLESEPELLPDLLRSAAEMLRGDLRVFGRTWSLGAQPEAWPWNRDWLCGHEWPLHHYLAYDHYEYGKKQPYDVKHPWELSRLNFLARPVLAATLTGDERIWAGATRILDAFLGANPYGHSVNWNPMECSMRGINLAVCALLAAQATGPAAAEFLRRCLCLAELHGRFVWRNLEYTAVRGNHYAANITALLLLGELLRGQVAEAAMWSDHAQSRVGPEILDQFLEDGVQMEKSIPYHRLVAQLFLLCTIATERAGKPLAAAARERLRRAFVYMRACVRPDGLSPVWGDSDDARACWFDEADARDHRLLLDFAAGYFGDAGLTAGHGVPLEGTLFLGQQGMVSAAPLEGMNYFEHGGMVAVHSGGDYLLVDVGEVGLRGQGGHGHLDATSFELSLGGEALVVDPGSYVYTGDLEAKRRFRGSAAHNTIMVDAMDAATMPQLPWSLGREADPVDVRVRDDGEEVHIDARHRGFERLADPVRYRRELRFERGARRLTLREHFECAAGHTVLLHLHLAPGIRSSITPRGVELETRAGRFLLQHPAHVSAALDEGWVSPAYFQKVAAIVVRLSWQIAPGVSESTLHLAPLTDGRS